MSSKSTVSEFVRSLGLPGFQWFGAVGVRALGRDRVVRVEPSEHVRVGYPTQGIFVGLRVEVVNKHSGHVDDVYLYFDEVGMVRGDQRQDYEGGFSVHSSAGWSWYIARPKTTKPLVDAVEAWIGLYA